MRQILIAGLGNPGVEYVNTRHNLGFMVVDLLAGELDFPSWEKECRSKVTSGIYNGTKLILAKPQTYMNLSGNAVLSLMTTYKIPPGDLIVVLDDFNLPFGRIRLRPCGSDGGHNGLGSIVEKLGRKDIVRLRIGIGCTPPGIDTVDFVLGPFFPEEKKELPQILKSSAESIKTLINEGIDIAMNKFNN